jgi:hypothetical protein
MKRRRTRARNAAGIELSAGTSQRIALLFTASDVPEVARMLIERCGAELSPLGSRATPASLERLRYAALRLSGGDLRRLSEALDLAHTDWRDLLMAADFGHDIEAHQRWRPQRLDPVQREHWRSGNALRDVTFARGDRVEIVTLQTQEPQGRVVDLLAMDPAPLYLVELASGEGIEASQARLRKPS